MNIEPSIKVEGATKLYKDKNDITNNNNMQYVVLDQNDEDTLLQKVSVDSEGKITKLDNFVVAWGLQKDGSWNQGHYYTDINNARKAFKDRAKARVVESNDFPAFLAKAKQNTTAKTMMAIAQKYGYTLRTPYIASWGEMQLTFIPKDDYYPSVYWYSEEFSTAGEFRINNASYGSMPLNKYRTILSNCQKALNMCEELSNIDLNSLEREPAGSRE